MENPWTLVDDDEKLRHAEKNIRTAAVVAVDTEYDSFRYFYEKLCLLQVQTGEKTWLIDPLAGIDISFLGEVFESPETLKIFHAGDNDIRILKRDYSFSFNNIFDTHRAASLLGVRLLALSRLLEGYLGVVIEKKMQRSRWDLRPLSNEQLDYAALDTAYLPALYKKLEADLVERGLEKEARRVFDGVAGVVWKPKELDAYGYRKMPGFRKLDPAKREKVKRLYRWRFEKAQATDRACFMLLSDQQLAAIAGLEEISPEKIVGPGLLNSSAAHRYGAEIVEILTH